MINIDNNTYSISEVASYLGVPASYISERWARTANNTAKALHEHLGNIRHPTSGINLSSVKGYYINNNGQDRCVYAEYSDANGKGYSFIEHHGKPVSSQIREDTILAHDLHHISTKRAENDDQLTKLNYTSLKIMEQSLDSFIQELISNCDEFETNLTFLQMYLKDDTSEQILKKSNSVTNRIKDAIQPAKILKDIVSNILKMLRQNAL